MTEVELNTIFDTVSDPVKNVYKLETQRDLDEIKRIIKVFNIVEEQKETCSKISARGLVAFKMLVSNN